VTDLDGDNDIDLGCERTAGRTTECGSSLVPAAACSRGYADREQSLVETWSLSAAGVRCACAGASWWRKQSCSWGEEMRSGRVRVTHLTLYILGWLLDL
jgi:hypothetical protein